jgi:hypothetical protein
MPVDPEIPEAPAASLTAPVVYVTDLTFAKYDPADLFDLAFLLRSPEHDLRGVCFAQEAGGERTLTALTVRAQTTVRTERGSEGLRLLLTETETPLNLVVVGGYATVADVLENDRPLFRERVARLFLVGGHVNTYHEHSEERRERLPFDPRLRERNPERFAPSGDSRITDREQGKAFGKLLISGEGVIWLPRDICLWRYAAPGILSDSGPVTEFLLRELYTAELIAAPDRDRYEAADAPVLLSALPALLLAAQPDPFPWMRLFRTVTARVETNEVGTITAFETKTDRPNLYAVIAIDGQNLGKHLTARLRG